METKKLSHETVQKILRIQRLEKLLDIIVVNFSDTTKTSPFKPKDIAIMYAVAQRDYWDTNTHLDGFDILRQIWTDALVFAAVENDWTTLEQAIRFDRIHTNPTTTIGQQRFDALVNLTKLL